MFDARDLLLIAHVAAAILFLGPLTVATSLFPRHAGALVEDPGQRGVAEVFHRISRAYGNTSVIVALLGLALAAQEGYLDEPWVLVSLVLFAGMGALLFGLVVPGQRRLLDGVEARHELPRLRMASGLVPVAWIAILVLMVTKPS